VPTIVEPRQTGASFSSARVSSSPSSGNLLDFTDSKPVATSPSSNSFLAATIQPQRRGRPTRGPVATSPNATSPSNLTASPQAYGSRLPAKPVSSPTPSSDSRPQSISPQPQLVNDIKRFAAEFSDAFEPDVGKNGVPRSPGEKTDAFGFENSFAPSPTLKPSNQKISPMPTSKSLQPGVGNGVSSSSGFETSFSPASPAANAALSSSKTANVSAGKVQDAPGANSATTDGHMSFEDRYPTLERLHSNNSAESPSGSTSLISPLNSASDNGSRTFAKPQRGSSLQRSMPSYHQASLTGGAFAEAHVASSNDNGSVPLPRSNQVTGTAFKMSDSPPERSPVNKAEGTFERIASPAASPGESSLPDYIDLPSPTAEPARVAPIAESASRPAPQEEAAEDRSIMPEPDPMRDLLTGDDGTSLPFLSMQPSKQPMRPLTGNRAPPPLAAKPPSLSINLGSAQSRPPLSKTHSSMYDGEWSPLDVAKRDLSRASVSQTSSAERYLQLNSTDQQIVTSPMNEDQQPLISGSHTPPPRNGPAQSDQRSQTLSYRTTDPLIPASKPSTYPIPGEKPLTTTSRRPDSLQRESSIHGLVSGFDAIQTSDAGSSIYNRERPVVAQKPRIASKPDQLKAPGPVSSPSSYASTDLTRNRSISNSRGSVPRTFDYVPPASSEPSVNSTHIPTQAETRAATNEDQRDVPRRNVNALIAQWNQAGPPAQGTPASALRAKPPIGTGRRL
jgi:AP2-associated kinase